MKVGPGPRVLVRRLVLRLFYGFYCFTCPKSQPHQALRGVAKLTRFCIVFFQPRSSASRNARSCGIHGAHFFSISCSVLRPGSPTSPQAHTATIFDEYRLNGPMRDSTNAGVLTTGVSLVAHTYRVDMAVKTSCQHHVGQV